MLKAAHAKPAVLEYVRREYRCADCDAHTKPQPSRKAAIPRTYEFNRIIALDVFYIPLRGQSLPILNIICHGTNFQVAALMRQDGTPTAAMVWSTFQRSWRRYFGTPDVMITDGGPEFRGDFAQSGEYAGILQVIVDADALGRKVSVKDMGVWSRIFWRRASKLKLFSHLTIWKTFWQRLCR